MGYTNAGKSTLLNQLTRAEVQAEDALFATLDPTSRRLDLGDRRGAILTDTVGFIRDLPLELIEAFRATLEEVIEADLLVHVIDISNPEAEVHVAEVGRVLGALAVTAPTLRLLNKADAVNPADWPRLRARLGGVLCSARTQEGAEPALAAIERALSPEHASRRALPYLQAWELEALAEEGAFEAAAGLRGRWLPAAEGAPPPLLSLQAVARFLCAAEATPIPHHGLRHLERAGERLVGLENALAAGTGPLARAHAADLGRGDRAAAGVGGRRRRRPAV